MSSYYVIVVFDLPRESEYRFTVYPNPDSLIEYPLIRTQFALDNHVTLSVDFSFYSQFHAEDLP